MLKKLLKYDFKNIYSFYLVFYGLSLIFAVFTKIFSLLRGSLIADVFYRIFLGATFSMICSIIINSVMRLWVEFRLSFYGDRSYLTHTLPVKTQTIFLSKFLFSVLTIFVSMIVIALSLFIALYSKENYETLKVFVEKTITSFDISFFGLFVCVVLLCFTQFLLILQSGYLGMIIGYKRNDKKLGYSVIFGFVVYFASQFLTLFIALFISLFNKTIFNTLFLEPEVVEFWVVKLFMFMVIILDLIYNVVLYFISNNLIKKGIDVD